MKDYTTYQNPLTGRYASKEMSYNFSPQRKHSTWRRLWLALAAEILVVPREKTPTVAPARGNP